MRLIARYVKEQKDSFELITVFDNKSIKQILDKDNPKADSLMREYLSAIWFKRKIRDDFGIEFEGAFDKRALVHHERFPNDLYPMRKDFAKKSIEYDRFKPYSYETIGGDSVFEVAVGPIHAGIIEPGHFHFSQSGERMLHLEVRHFYKYRAIEKSLEGKTLIEAKPIIERISGNESIAYQIAWRDIVCKACEIDQPVSLRRYHAILLEMERVIHHLTDIGFIPNDAGFGVALAYASRMNEDARRVLKLVSGHRFGFGAVGFDAKEIDVGAIKTWLKQLEDDIAFFEEWIMDIPSLWDRFDITGKLSRDKAIKYGVVGVVARASGVGLDIRDDDFYKEYGYEKQILKKGDVADRFKLRILEIKNSITLIKNLLIDEVEGVKPGAIKDGEYVSFSESSIGKLFMAIDIKDGIIDRFYARDPSFVNWQALHLMMLNDIIADFPLINKSCDLSYAGNDL